MLPSVHTHTTHVTHTHRRSFLARVANVLRSASRQAHKKFLALQAQLEKAALEDETLDLGEKAVAAEGAD